MFSKKATKFVEIFTEDLTLGSKFQIHNEEDFILENMSFTYLVYTPELVGTNHILISAFLAENTNKSRDRF